MIRIWFAATIMLSAVAAADAGPVLNVFLQPTPGLPGFSTVIFTLSSDMPGEAFTSLQGTFLAPAMNQITPADRATVFQDRNPAITISGGDILQDSQFKFHPITDRLLVGAASESSTHLSAAFTSFPPFESRDIAQLVLPDGIHGTADLTVVLAGKEIRLPRETFGVPEPTSRLPVVFASMLGCAVFRAKKR